jgi:hypothetical protein
MKGRLVLWGGYLLLCTGVEKSVGDFHRDMLNEPLVLIEGIPKGDQLFAAAKQPNPANEIAI